MITILRNIRGLVTPQMASSPFHLDVQENVAIAMDCHKLAGRPPSTTHGIILQLETYMKKS